MRPRHLRIAQRLGLDRTCCFSLPSIQCNEVIGDTRGVEAVRKEG
jgi:hypothetical protein